MALDCTCGDSNKGDNMGGHAANCPAYGVTRFFAIGQRTKASGLTNGLIIGVDIPDSDFWNGKFRDPIFSDRLLWSPEVIDASNPVVDDNIETLANGSIKFLSKGIRQVTFPIYTSEPYKLAKQLLSNGCRDLGFYESDGANIQGEVKNGIFNLRKIQQGSFTANAVPQTDSVSSHVLFVFNIDRISKDTIVDFISSESMDGYDMASTEPLSDVFIKNFTAVGPTVEFDLVQAVGGVLSKIPATGLAALLDITEDGVPAPTDSFDETTDGHYVAVITTPFSGGEVIEVRFLGGVIYVQLSYDGKALIGVTVIATV